eukprot:755722-Heterocapsa_arctica.AAC.1
MQAVLDEELKGDYALLAKPVDASYEQYESRDVVKVTIDPGEPIRKRRPRSATDAIEQNNHDIYMNDKVKAVLNEGRKRG